MNQKDCIHKEVRQLKRNFFERMLYNSIYQCVLCGKKIKL